MELFEDSKSFSLDLEQLLKKTLTKIHDEKTNDTILRVKFIDTLPNDVQVSIEYTVTEGFRKLFYKVDNGYKF